MRNLPWASIDNDDSRDLDQLTVAETMPEGAVKILVAIADVDAIVKKGSAIDDHARQNTTSVYTAAGIFPMLPEKLSTDLTSLGYREDRPAIVIEMVVGEDGSLRSSDLYGATVRNRAKLAYNGVAEWLEGKGPAPGPIADVGGLAENLRIQDRVAQQLKAFRHEHGALDLETIEARPVFDGDVIRDLEAEREEPCERAHRGLHDRGQRGDRAVPERQEVSLPAARGPLPQAVGTDRRSGIPVRRNPPAGARSEGARAVSGREGRPPILSAFPIFPLPSSS